MSLSIEAPAPQPEAGFRAVADLILRLAGLGGHKLAPLQTRYSIEQCKAKLLENADVERFGLNFSGYAGHRPVLLKFNDDNVRLQMRRYYNNPHGPYFYGRLERVENGTRISGNFQIHPVTKVCSLAWLSFAVLFWFVGVATFVERPNGDSLIFLVMNVGMLAFGVLLIRFSRWLARNEEPAIVSFLQTSLEATPAF